MGLGRCTSTFQKKDFASLSTSLCSPSPASSDLLLSSILEHLCGPRSEEGNIVSWTSENIEQSGDRWRTVFTVWRKVLDCDALFLALLLHSGCMWSVNYDYFFQIFWSRIERTIRVLLEAREKAEEETDSTPSSADLTLLCIEVLESMKEDYPFDSFALLLLHFLCLVEVFSVPFTSTAVYSLPCESSLPLFSSFSFHHNHLHDLCRTCTSLNASCGGGATPASRREEAEECFHTSDEFFFPDCLEMASSMVSAHYFANRSQCSQHSGGANVHSSSSFPLPQPLPSFCFSRLCRTGEDNVKKDRKGMAGSGAPSLASCCVGESGVGIFSSASFDSFHKKDNAACRFHRSANERDNTERYHRSSVKGFPTSSSAFCWSAAVNNEDVMEVKKVACDLVEEWFRLMDHPYLHSGSTHNEVTSSNGNDTCSTSAGIIPVTRKNHTPVNDSASSNSKIRHRMNAKLEEENKTEEGLKESHFLASPALSSFFPIGKHSQDGDDIHTNVKNTRKKRKRDLWFASAIKLSSYVSGEGDDDGIPLVDHHPHLRCVADWQKKEWGTIRELLCKSFPAIFLCLLEQETCMMNKEEEEDVIDSDIPCRQDTEEKLGEGKEKQECSRKGEGAKREQEQKTVRKEEERDRRKRWMEKVQGKEEATALRGTCEGGGDTDSPIEDKAGGCNIELESVKALCLPPIPLLLPFHLFGKRTTISVPRPCHAHESAFGKGMGSTPLQMEEGKEEEEVVMHKGENVKWESRLGLSPRMIMKRRMGGSQVYPGEDYSVLEQRRCQEYDEGNLKPGTPATTANTTTPTGINSIKVRAREGQGENIVSAPPPYARSSLSCTPGSGGEYLRTCFQMKPNTKGNRFHSSSADSVSVPKPSFSSSFPLPYSLPLVPNSPAEQEAERNTKAVLAKDALQQLWWRHLHITSNGFVVYHRIAPLDRPLFEKYMSENVESVDAISDSPSSRREPLSCSTSTSSTALSGSSERRGEYMYGEEEENVGVSVEKGLLHSVFSKGAKRTQEEDKDKRQVRMLDRMDDGEAEEDFVGLGVALSGSPSCPSSFLRPHELQGRTKERSTYGLANPSEIQQSDQNQVLSHENAKIGQEEEIPLERREKNPCILPTAPRSVHTTPVLCSLFQLRFAQIEGSDKMPLPFCPPGIAKNHKQHEREEEKVCGRRGRKLRVQDSFLGRKEDWEGSTSISAKRVTNGSARKEGGRGKRTFLHIKKKTMKTLHSSIVFSVEEDDEREEMEKEGNEKENVENKNEKREEKAEEIARATQSRELRRGEGGLCPHVWLLKCGVPSKNTTVKKSSPSPCPPRTKGSSAHRFPSRRRQHVSRVINNRTASTSSARKSSVKNNHYSSTTTNPLRHLFSRSTTGRRIPGYVPGSLHPSLFSSSSSKLASIRTRRGMARFLSSFGSLSPSSSPCPSFSSSYLGHSFWLLYDTPSSILFPPGVHEGLPSFPSAAVDPSGVISRAPEPISHHYRSVSTANSCTSSGDRDAYLPVGTDTAVGYTRLAVEWFQDSHDVTVRGTSPFTGVVDKRRNRARTDGGWVVQCSEEGPLMGIPSVENEGRGRGVGWGGGDSCGFDKKDEHRQREETDLSPSLFLSRDPLYQYLKGLFCTARRVLSLRGIGLRSFCSSSSLSRSSPSSFLWRCFSTPEAEELAVAHLSHSFALLALLLGTVGHFFPSIAIGAARRDIELATRGNVSPDLPQPVQMWLSEVTSFLADTSLAISSQPSLPSSSSCSPSFRSASCAISAGRRDSQPSLPVDQESSSLPCPSGSICPLAGETKGVHQLSFLLRGVCFALALHPVVSESILVAVGWIARMVQLDVESAPYFLQKLKSHFPEPDRHPPSCSSSCSPVHSSGRTSLTKTSPPPHFPLPRLLLWTTLVHLVLENIPANRISKEENEEVRIVGMSAGSAWLSVCMPEGWWTLWYKAQKEVGDALRRCAVTPLIPSSACKALEKTLRTSSRIGVDRSEGRASQDKAMEESGKFVAGNNCMRVGDVSCSSWVSSSSPATTIVVKEKNIQGQAELDNTEMTSNGFQLTGGTERDLENTWNEPIHRTGEEQGTPLEGESRSSYYAPPHDGADKSNTAVAKKIAYKVDEKNSQKIQNVGRTPSFSIPMWQSKASFGIACSVLSLHSRVREFGAEEEEVVDMLQGRRQCRRIQENGTLERSNWLRFFSGAGERGRYHSASPSTNSAVAVYYMYGDAVYRNTRVPPSFRVQF